MPKLLNIYATFAFLWMLSVLTEAEVPPREVQYALRTRANPTNDRFVSPLDVSTVSSSKPVKILVHGWGASGNDTWILNMTKAMLQTGDYSIIAVNWHTPSAVAYPLAIRNSRDVGKIIGDLVVKLNRERNISLDNFHLLGHSLGAHVVGFAGKEVKRVEGSVVQRVTALDAAGPGFEIPLQPPSGRVYRGDARVVEGVHTDGGVLGFVSPFGDIDFYPNGGLYIQPNCIELTNEILEDAVDAVSCSHGKAPQYYWYAWERGGITATKCSSWIRYISGACNGNENATFASQDPPTQKGRFYFRIVTNIP